MHFLSLPVYSRCITKMYMIAKVVHFSPHTSTFNCHLSDHLTLQTFSTTVTGAAQVHFMYK